MTIRIAPQELLAEWRYRFLKGHELSNLLNNVGMENHELADVTQAQFTGDSRFYVVANIKNRKSEKPKRLVIDVKHGLPSWAQMMNVTFNAGSQCDLRVVIFDRAFNPDDRRDPTIDQKLAEDFTEILNRHGHPTYLIQARVWNYRAEVLEFDYKCIAHPDHFPKTTDTPLPGKRRFQEIEFWCIYFDQVIGGGYTPWIRGDQWFSHTISKSLGGLIITPRWENKGLYMLATPQSPEKAETLASLWIDNHRVICDNYDERAVRLHRKDGRPAKLSVKVFNGSFSEIGPISPDGKRKLARMVRGEMERFVRLIEDLI